MKFASTPTRAHTHFIMRTTTRHKLGGSNIHTCSRNKHCKQLFLYREYELPQNYHGTTDWRRTYGFEMGYCQRRSARAGRNGGQRAEVGFDFGFHGQSKGGTPHRNFTLWNFARENRAGLGEIPQQRVLASSPQNQISSATFGGNDEFQPHPMYS